MKKLIKLFFNALDLIFNKPHGIMKDTMNTGINISTISILLHYPKPVLIS